MPGTPDRRHQFFRDPEAFELLCSRIIPALFASRKPDEPVRIWHASCATGEEAYSVAMLILEYLEEEGLQAKVQIFATDLDEVAVAQGQGGTLCRRQHPRGKRAAPQSFFYQR